MSELNNEPRQRGDGGARRCLRNNGGVVDADGGDAGRAFVDLDPPQGKQSDRQRLPYGKWTCADGREVLFNRAYKPIWQRSPDGLVTRADPEERVPWVVQEFYFNDGNAPIYPTWLPPRPLTAERKATRKRCMAVLKDWDVG
jgi:hypothetical protein